MGWWTLCAKERLAKYSRALAQSIREFAYGLCFGLCFTGFRVRLPGRRSCLAVSAQSQQFLSAVQRRANTQCHRLTHSQLVRGRLPNRCRSLDAVPAPLGRRMLARGRGAPALATLSESSAFAGNRRGRQIESAGAGSDKELGASGRGSDASSREDELRPWAEPSSTTFVVCCFGGD